MMHNAKRLTRQQTAVFGEHAAEKEPESDHVGSGVDLPAVDAVDDLLRRGVTRREKLETIET